MPTDAIERKIKQAEFHLAHLIDAKSDDFVAECYFAAFLACLRSCVFYVHEWQITTGRAINGRDYTRIHAWENTLRPGDLERWKVLTRPSKRRHP